MMRYLRGSERTLLAVVLLAVLNGALPGVGVVALQRALDGILAGEPEWDALAALAFLGVLTPAAQIGRAYLSRRLGADRIHHLRVELHRQLHRLGGPGSAGDRLAALEEVDALRYAISALVTSVRAPLAAVVLVTSAVWVAPSLAWRGAALVPLAVTIAWAGGRVTGRLARNWRLARAELLRELADQHSGIATTLDHEAMERQLERAASRSRAEASARARLEWWRAVPGASLQGMLVIAVAALLGSSLSDLASGRLTAGQIVGFAVALGLLRGPLVRSAEILTLWSRARASLERVDALLNREAPVSPPVPSGEGFRLTGVEIPGRLRIEELHIAHGERVAVVGASGAGKSTLLALLAGRLRGGDGTLEPSVWCRQEPWIFDRTIGENLELAGPLPDGALERLDAALDLGPLRGRLDASAGEQGSRLSGGERQRLALARALLVPERALLLDEATSELPPAHARRVAAFLAELDRTVVMATHAPWFPARADRVLWLDGGEVRGDARHAELMGDPAYAALWGPERKNPPDQGPEGKSG